MIVSLGPVGAFEVMREEDLGSFAVHSESTIPEISADHGYLDQDGRHVWVRVDAIREAVAERVSPAWHPRFGAMVDYANASNWLNDQGTHIRGHLCSP